MRSMSGTGSAMPVCAFGFAMTTARPRFSHLSGSTVSPGPMGISRASKPYSAENTL